MFAPEFLPIHILSVVAQSYFQFKQFRIHQDRVAMKVSTDACIQGAWTPIPAGAQRALDMGSGSGLLALFLAQRGPQLHIDALEISEEDARQGAENLMASPWARRLVPIQGDHAHFFPHYGYELICTNPPFYVDSLPAHSAPRERARHLSRSGQRQWLESIGRLLAPEGRLSIQYPADREGLWSGELRRLGLILESELRIRAYPSRPPYRVVGLWRSGDSSFLSSPVQRMNLSVYLGKGEGYSPEFRDLMKDFYLFL